jgi:hypothetical protein
VRRRQFCKCGKCKWCPENARWARIFNEKFANPAYYGRLGLGAVPPSRRSGEHAQGSNPPQIRKYIFRTNQERAELGKFLDQAVGLFAGFVGLLPFSKARLWGGIAHG